MVPVTMRPRVPSALLTGILAALALAVPAAGAHSTGTPSQIAWIRRAAGNFLSAELQGNGAAACGVLDARLRGHDCARRWDSRLSAMLHRPGARKELQADSHAVSSATVLVTGKHATIDLPHPLYDGANHLTWTEMCWMVER
jgi:hypothetical protein